MKKVFTILLLMIGFVGMAQTELSVSGLVFTNDPVNEPIVNQSITIDVYAGGALFASEVVYSDSAGVYQDFFTLNTGQGQVVISTHDCDSSLVSYTHSFSGDSLFVYQAFALCGDVPPGCVSYFESEIQEPLTVAFNNQSEGATMYLWDFGDGQSSNDENPVHQYSQFGAYNVQLTISDTIIFCTSTYSSLVVLSDSVGGCDASFEYDYNPISPLTIDFVNTSMGNPQIFTWDFGDGSYSNEQNPQHIYNQSGYYQVCLTIMSNDSSCWDMSCMQLSLGNDSLGCQADYTYYPAEDSIIPYTEPLTYQFVNLSLGNPDYWFWDFGDGSSTSEVNPVHTFPEPGVYNVCLTIGSNDSSCYSTYCQEVVLQDDSVSCVAQFVHFPSDTVPSELNIQFMDLSYGNATSWSWDFGDGAYASEQNPMHTYAAEGNYYVCLTISSPVCQSVWCEEITVGSEIDCFNYFTWQTVDNTAVFSGVHSSDMEAFYFWEFGDGISGTGQTVTHTYSGPGIYYVSLLSYDDGNTCSAQSSQMVVIGDTIAYNQVYGQVFAGDFPLEDGFVMIFSLDTNVNYAPFFDVAMLDPSGVYVFPYVPNGEFLLYAVDLNFSNYLPTYYGDVINWEDATMISLGQANNPYNINMVNATSTPLGGNGTISGQITNSAVKSAGFLDKINMLLFDENKVAIGYTSVSADGEFNLDNLEMGVYYLYPELSGVSAQFIKVELSAEQPDVQVYMTFSGGSITGIDNPEQIVEIGEIFPNPVGDQLNINVNSKQLQEVVLSITGIDGQVYATSRVHLNSGNDQIRMNVDDLPRGMFILHIAGNHQVNLNKKFIR